MATQEPLVLVVDDEAGILQLIKLEFAAQGFRVVTASNGVEALEKAEEQRPDIILLDILMPGMTGLEVMRKLRETSNIPVLLVTAKDSDTDKVKGLELGADDYIVKPFNPEELSARIRAVLRRSVVPADAKKVVQAGEIEIDLNRRLVMRNGVMVSLTRTEWLLLQSLALNAGKVILNAQLLSKVWGPEYSHEVPYLRVWVSRLRRKLEPDPSDPVVIKTLPGIGYLLNADPDAPQETESQEVAAAR